MNKWQRIILIVGAFVFYFTIITTPQVTILSDGVIMKPNRVASKLAPVADVRTAAVRGFTILGVTALLFFAAKSKKKD